MLHERGGSIDTVKDYLLSIAAAALVCGIVNSIAGKTGSISQLLKLLCGLFLAATVIKPLVDIRVESILDFTKDLTLKGEMAVSQGEDMASEEMKRIIKEKTEAYILDKANALGAEITVEVALKDYIPAGVTIMGDISPFAKSSLSATIAQELDISPEEQIWIRS